MKKKNLLLFALLASISINITGCKRNTPPSSSSSEEPILSVSMLTPEKALEEAANVLYDMYKDSINSFVYDNFEVTKKFHIFDDERIDVTWELSILKGEGDGVRLINAKDRDNYQGIYVGFYDDLIKSEMEFELIPTLDYKGTSKKFKDILGNEKRFIYKVEKLSPINFNEYIALCKEAGPISDNKNKTCLMNLTVLTISLDGKNIFLHDEENNGVLCFDTEYSKNDFFPGDKVSVIGKCFYDNNTYLINKPKINLISRSDPSYGKPEYLDVTSIYSDYSTFNENINIHQNSRISVNNVTFSNISSDVVLFLLNGKEYKILRDNNYFLTEQENNMLFENIVSGTKANVKGILRCIEGEYYIIPDTVDSFELVE